MCHLSKTLYKWINGETWWILITDYFSGIKHGDARISKVSPISWLKNLLNHFPPTCNYKYLHLNQWDELFNNPYLKNLLQLFGFTIHTTVSDTSHQNGPVRWSRMTLANSIWAMLTVANVNLFLAICLVRYYLIL